MPKEVVTSLLVIEDDPAVAGNLVRGLRREGFAVDLATDGEAGLTRALEPHHDLVILDLMLPERDGFEILARVRDRITIPVIVLSARDDLSDRLRTFDLGAVDFVAKPFWLEELVARIRTRLRLDEERPRRVVAWRDVSVDLDARTVHRGGEPIGVTRAELDVLAHLLERRGRAVSRRAIADAVLGEQETRERTVDTHVARLRKKLGDDAAAALHTVWGIGYRFEPEDP